MSDAHLIAAFYLFARIDDPAETRFALARRACGARLAGTLLVASEGLNGTLAGEADALRGFLDALRGDRRFAALTWKESWSAAPPFRALKVRLKREIVSMGAPDIVTPETVGTYVAPKDWNALIDDPKVAVVDVRNDYETRIGSFIGAIDPATARFRDFPEWARDWSARTPDGPVAMFCTGGIRCEKATAFLRSIGRREVHHLDGGVLRYLEEVPAQESRWRGQCFVFDERVSVGHGLSPGDLGLCRGCRRPIDARDVAHPAFEEGVACPACAAETTPAQRAARRERLRQMRLAAERGRNHLGDDTRSSVLMKTGAEM